MKQLLLPLSLMMSLLLYTPSSQAQLVNFDDTWVEFLSNPKTSNISKLTKPNKASSPEFYLKYCLMYSNTYFCSGDIANAGKMMLEIKGMGKEQYEKIPRFVEKYEKLNEDFDAYKAVHGLWTRFSAGEAISIEELEKEENARGKAVCEKRTLAKYFQMTANAYYCNGELDKAKEHFEGRVLKLAESTTFKVEDVTGLPDEVDRSKKIYTTLPKLDKAWASFLEDEKSVGFPEDMPIVECYSIPNMKIFLLRAAVDVCKYGPENYKKIERLLKSNTHDLPEDVDQKIKWLKKEVESSSEELADLNSAWDKFTKKHTTKTWEEGFPEVDTVLGEEINLVEFYCDKIAQTKSWVIKGSLNACEEGQKHLDLIDELKKKYNLDYPKELACQVQRLRGKVYQCNYWPLVLEARKKTHEERERFGPLAAEMMYEELNGPKLPCETTVEYNPLGYIGVNYVIKVYLCQRINLAKMGDPEFYKKISNWVDEKVLTEYCNTTNWRCKEDFTIYLEGHTDGHPFKPRTYDHKIGIPKNTPYTYHNETDTIEKKLDKVITDKLKNNMELGLARAWTVKKQLDFMKVPISIGCYEHPKEEKGGEYRMIQIHLKINNLLLDFYEKLLNELIEESGIGERPKAC
jgi:hypothetical protein